LSGPRPEVLQDTQTRGRGLVLSSSKMQCLSAQIRRHCRRSPQTKDFATPYPRRQDQTQRPVRRRAAQLGDNCEPSLRTWFISCNFCWRPECRLRVDDAGGRGDIEPGLELGKHTHSELEGDDIGVGMKGVPATHGATPCGDTYRLAARFLEAFSPICSIRVRTSLLPRFRSDPSAISCALRGRDLPRSQLKTD
jgi:hypothetical protein